MNQHVSIIKAGLYLLAAWVLLMTGCTTTLVKDPANRETSAESTHCSGGDWVSDSSVAVLPIPIVAFFVPHADTNEISADTYLSKCGDSTKLVNRNVEVNRAACVPASLTQILTLGVWQWCPAHVSWEADVES